VCDCHDLGDYDDLFRDEDILYRRVLEKHVADGKVTTAHCQTKQWKEGLSCDWSVIARPEEVAKGLPYLLTFTVGQCRTLDIHVRYCPHVDPHDPLYNLAHCLLVLPPQIKGRSEIARVRDRLLEVAILRATEAEPEHKWQMRIFNWIRARFYSSARGGDS